MMMTSPHRRLTLIRAAVSGLNGLNVSAASALIDGPAPRLRTGDCHCYVNNCAPDD
jgi:hypothetical protein